MSFDKDQVNNDLYIGTQGMKLYIVWLIWSKQRRKW